MQPRREQPIMIGIGLLFLLLISGPYIYANFAAAPNHYFTGFLFNPVDGNSYLAKMLQGYRGSWQFTLPYTVEAGEGAYFNLFYVFLGHVARILELPVLLVFHLARITASLFLLKALYHFFRQTFTDQRTFWLAFVLSLFASGLGWLAVPFGLFTSDFWVAEAFPFLSAYANPHFPLGLALQLSLLAPGRRAVTWWNVMKTIVAALLLALIFPFGVPVVLLAWTGVLLWNLARREDVHPIFLRLIGISLGAVPILLYDYVVIQNHPQLSVWNVQNLTPTPPPWELMIAFSPALIFAILGFRVSLREPQESYRLLASWLVLSMLLLYIPFNLQRRFLSGIFIPIAGLAAIGLSHLAALGQRHYRWPALLVFVLSIPTNLIILATGFFGAVNNDASIYMTHAEQQGISWIAENVPQGAVVLSGPDTGLFIPAHSSARVLYGHPFETINAEGQERLVTGFFQQGLSTAERSDFIDAQNISYIFYGPRERQLGDLGILDDWSLVFRLEDVEIYRVEK